MPDDTTPAICGDRCDGYPETVCTDPPRHRLPHGGPLIINGRHCGGAAWGPDHGYADAPAHQATPARTTPDNPPASSDTADNPEKAIFARVVRTLMRGERRQRARAEKAEAAIARVRALHQRSDKRRPLDLSVKPIVHCAHCNNDWPCDTIRALDSVETTCSENAASPMSQTPS